MHLKSEELTELDAHVIADIIWWIKGYNAARDDCDICSHHIETLRKVKLAIERECDARDNRTPKEPKEPKDPTSDDLIGPF